METIFKSAVNCIKANENLKRKTGEYLMKNLTAMPSASNPIRIKRPVVKRAIAAACTAVFVCAASIGAYAYYKTPASYLSLDINPSVELGVNPFGKVVSAMAYNNDGKTILDGQHVMGSNVKNAVSTLVKSAAQKGFIAKDGSTVIAVTSETDNSATAAELQDAAEQGADSAVEAEGDTATIVKDNVALARRDEARKLGITPGKLNLIQKLQALDSSITVDQYKDAKVKDIMKKFVELKKAASPNQGKDGKGTSSSAGNEDSETASQAVSSESGKTAAAQSHAPSANNNSDSQAASGESGKAAAAQSRAQTASSKANPNATVKSVASASSAASSQQAGNKSKASNGNSEKSGNMANSVSKTAGGNTNHGNSVASSHKK